MSSEEELSASPFEIKNVDEEEEQEIINTISQDNIVAFEEQEIVLAVLPEGDEKVNMTTQWVFSSKVTMNLLKKHFKNL